jgi:hypothetical protein
VRTLDGSGETGADETSVGVAEDTVEPTTGEAPLELTPDEQLCLDRCTHWQETACPYFDEGCYGSCLSVLEFFDQGACAAEARASMACETEHPLDDSCEAAECRDVYLQDDLCRGFCYHLGGYPSGGASQEDCHWEATSCYGHDFTVQCTLGDAPICDCTIDGMDAGSCELDQPLKAFSCGGDEFHVFSGCCTETFLAVIQ